MMIRKLLVPLLLLSAAFTSAASEPYFCTEQGKKLNYVRTDSDNASIVWMHTMTIDSVSGKDSKSIKYSSLFTKENGSKMYGGQVCLTADIDASGNVRMSVAESLASVFGNLVGQKNVKQEGGITMLPSDMKPGDALPDVKGSASAGPVRLSVTVSQRKVLEKDTITTPAGTFECIVVQEHKVEKGIRNRVTTARTWYAAGIGMVRHDTYDKNMRLDTSEVLQSIE